MFFVWLADIIGEVNPSPQGFPEIESAFALRVGLLS